jgi:hypothetical protein
MTVDSSDLHIDCVFFYYIYFSTFHCHWWVQVFFLISSFRMNLLCFLFFFVMTHVSLPYIIMRHITVLYKLILVSQWIYLDFNVGSSAYIIRFICCTYSALYFFFIAITGDYCTKVGEVLYCISFCSPIIIFCSAELLECVCVNTLVLAVFICKPTFFTFCSRSMYSSNSVAFLPWY